MTPIIEIQQNVHTRQSGVAVTILICRDPQHGGILRRKQLKSTLSPTEIAQTVIDFTQQMVSWWRPQISQPSIVSRCESILL